MNISITRRNIFAAVIMIAFVVFSTARGNDEQHFKNLKVLPKNITKDSLEHIMHDYNVALGVKCGFCHAKGAEGGRPDFASDDNKHKAMARKMMEMTADINKKYFDFSGENGGMEAVTCMTCHHGKKEPSDDLGAAPEAPQPPKPDQQPANK